MVGSALVRRFKAEPGVELLLRDRKQLDLTSEPAVAAFLAPAVLDPQLAARVRCEKRARVEPVLGDRPREDRRRLSGEVGDVGEQGAEVEGAREAGDGGGAVHA